jgi:SAM-dependent methyltransferase
MRHRWLRRQQRSPEQPVRAEPASGQDPRPSEPSGLTLGEFRDRLARGELSMERWPECSIAPSQVVLPAADPLEPAYAEAVMGTWRAITGRTSYDPVVDEHFEMDPDTFFARPYPYSTSDPQLIARYFGAIAAVTERLGATPPARVVELGSGWGHLALFLASAGFAVTAVDLHAPSVELLRRRADAMAVDVNVVRAGFLDFSPDGPVDVVVFFESFHHCDRPFELLDRCRSWLAPGGRLLFLADAVYDDFYAPWGVRLDGAACLMAANHGWLELGFRRAFLEDVLADRGFTTTWQVLPWLGDYGTVLSATLTR